MSPRTLAQICQPGIEIWCINLCHQGNLTLLLQIRLQKPKCRSVPFHGFGAMVTTFMIKHVIVNGSCEGCTRSAVGEQSLTLVLPLGLLRFRRFGRFLFASFSLSIQFGTLS